MTELPNANYLCYQLKSDKHISFSVEQRFHTEKKNVPPSDCMKERNLSPGPYTIW